MKISEHDALIMTKDTGEIITIMPEADGSWLMPAGIYVEPRTDAPATGTVSAPQ